MASTIIQIPGLIGDLTYTVDLVRPSDLSVLETGIALTLVSGVHQGTITGSYTGKFIFDIKHDGNPVDSRVRSIADDPSTYIILTGLDDGYFANPLDGALFSTGWGIAYSSGGQREDGVEISAEMIMGPNVSGFILDSQVITGTSATTAIDGVDVVGYVELTGLRRGAIYSGWRGEVGEFEPVSFRVPDAPTFRLSELLGQDA